jgi:hypothetical protein
MHLAKSMWLSFYNQLNFGHAASARSITTKGFESSFLFLVTPPWNYFFFWNVYNLFFGTQWHCASISNIELAFSSYPFECHSFWELCHLLSNLLSLVKKNLLDTMFSYVFALTLWPHYTNEQDCISLHGKNCVKCSRIQRIG